MVHFVFLILREEIRLHFAAYLQISTPLCNFSSQFYRAYDLVHFIFHIYRARDMVHLIIHKFLRGNSDSLCRLSSNLYATLQFILQNLPWDGAFDLPYFGVG